MDFTVLIIGADPNAYYMARCCYEAYNKKAYVIGHHPLPITTNSDIMNLSYSNLLWDESEFLKMLREFKKNHKEEVVLISTNETYEKFISKNRKELAKMYHFNYPDIKIINSLINKETFYKTYENSKLVFPKTMFYDFSKKQEINIPLPVIIKPSDVIKYNHITFPGKKKIYKIETKEELNKTLELIKKSDYDDTLIIQEFIPGGDDALFDAVIYANTKGKVEFISFAQVGLQERGKNIIGSLAVILNGFNTTKGDSDAQVKIFKEFMESIHYQGFANVDMKYDYRDNTFKVLEINARQGRGSYYVTPMGKNLVKVLVDDCLLGKVNEFKHLKDEVLLSYVPKKVVKKYITNEKLKEEVLSLWKKRVNPMKFKKDKNFKRKIMLFKKDLKYIKEFKNDTGLE